MRNKGFKCQQQNCETLPWKTISSSFISIKGVPSIQVSPLLTSTLFYCGNTHGSYAFSAYVITSIYHHLIYIDNSSIVNSLQQNSKSLKVFFSNPNQLFCNSHALLYHHFFCLSTFHVGFSFQKTIQNNIYKKRKPCCYTIFSNPSSLPLYSYQMLLSQHYYLIAISHTCFTKSCLSTNRLHLFIIGNLIKHKNLHY